MNTFPYEALTTFSQLRDDMIVAADSFAAISRSYDQLKAGAANGMNAPVRPAAISEVPATAKILTLPRRRGVSGNGLDYRAQGSRQALRRS